MLESAARFYGQNSGYQAEWWNSICYVQHIIIHFHTHLEYIIQVMNIIFGKMHVVDMLADCVVV